MATAASVTNLVTSTGKRPKAKVLARSRTNYERQQMYGAFGAGGVALVMTGLSLCDLAEGIQIMSGRGVYHAWALAIGTDLCYVSLEAAQMAQIAAGASEKARKETARWAVPATIVTLGWSAALNALSFMQGSEGVWYQVGSALYGVTIPGVIYAMSRVVTKMLLKARSEA